MKPEIISFSDIEKLKQTHPELQLDDHIDLAIDELFDIHFPEKKDSKTPEELNSFKAETVSNQNEWGEWVHYPWLNKVVHFPPAAEFRALRTSRNRNLINVEEQKTLYAATIMIAGMSVGSNIVEALVSQGIGSRFILVDMDIIEPSNLNRIRSPYHHVGLHKVEAISRKVWEIDPFIEVVAYNDGLNESNLQEIVANYKPNILIDEMDELKMKIAVREVAKANKLPVIMAADDGDDALIDIERYDLNPDMELFSGLIPTDVIERIKQGNIPRQELGMMIGKYFVGPDHVPVRMFESLMEVGKTLPSWPQLGGAAALSGVSLTYVAKKILLGMYVKEGRTLVSVEEKLSRVEPKDQEKLEKYKTMMFGQQNG